MKVLVERWAWLRHSWWFQWAHKPLCDAYREDVLRVGKLRLCRGCSALWAGVLAGAALALGAALDGALLSMAWFGCFALCAALSHPALHARWPRPLRDGLRFASGMLLPLALALFASAGTVSGAVALSLLVATYVLYARLRVGERLARCASCAELGQGICSGYTEQSDAIRVWEEAAAAREFARRLAR